jgi:RNA polymerase sigma-70 factor (ECF subfamily)
MNCIKELPSPFRSVFNLHAIEGYSHEEIAKILGIACSTSRANYFRARTLLQEKIKLIYK